MSRRSHMGPSVPSMDVRDNFIVEFYCWRGPTSCLESYVSSVHPRPVCTVSRKDDGLVAFDWPENPLAASASAPPSMQEV
jgi:hypothetical protein